MIPVLLLLVAVVAFRLTADGMGEFFPHGGRRALQRRLPSAALGLRLSLAAFAITEVVLNLRYGLAPVNPNTFPMLLGFALIFALGWSFRKGAAGPAANSPHLPLLFGGALLGSLLFYLVTNTGAWLANPAYARSLGGWVQALTTGVPGYPPTWVFFRNSLAGDLFFTALFVSFYVLPQRRRTATRASTTPAHALADSPWRS